MKACLVIPCFNEAKRLDERALHAFAASIPQVGLLFVDDGSSDDTAERLTELCAQHPSMSLLQLPHNMGKSEAVRRGVLHALEGEPRFVGYWDADLAAPLDELPRFLDVLEANPDLWLVMGARVGLLGRHIERKPVRHYLGRLFATCAALVLKLQVYDTQCGAKLLRVNQPTRRAFDQPFESRWLLDVELLARLSQHTSAPAALARHVYELPLDHWRDVAGSKVRPRDFVSALRELWVIRQRYCC